MTALTHNLIRISHRPAAAAGRALRSLVERWTTRHQRRQETGRLLEMDDRALADIGLTRGEAIWVARHPRAESPRDERFSTDYYVRKAHALRARAIAEFGRRLFRPRRAGKAKP